MNWVSYRLYIDNTSIVYRLLVIEPLYNDNISLVMARIVVFLFINLIKGFF